MRSASNAPTWWTRRCCCGATPTVRCWCGAWTRTPTISAPPRPIANDGAIFHLTRPLVFKAMPEVIAALERHWDELKLMEAAA